MTVQTTEYMLPSVHLFCPSRVLRGDVGLYEQL